VSDATSKTDPGGTAPDLPAAAVAAAAALSEALEVVEEARGALYRFHRLTGKADGKLDDAMEALRRAGAPDLADLVRRRLVGRDVLPDRWTFQVVEEYDDGYWSVFRDVEAEVRSSLTGGRRHVGEARMKRERQA
jgi:hypothetical protein